MLSFIIRNRIHVNSKLQDYCIKSTNDSVRKITEKYNEENKIQKVNFIPYSNSISNPSDPNSNIGIILCVIFFLSSSTYIHSFFKKIWLNLFSLNRYIDGSTI